MTARGIPDRSGFKLWQFTKRHKVWEVSPGLLVSPWHERGSIARPFLPAADSAADEQQPFLLQTLTTPLNDGNTGAAWERFLPLRFTAEECFCHLPLYLCTQSCHRRWWYPRPQAGEPWGMIHGTDQVRQGSTQRTSAVRWRTRDPPVYQWSRPQPARLWPAGWSSWASSAWTPCPPETLLRWLQNPWPHSARSRAPLTRFDCRRRPMEREGCWLDRGRAESPGVQNQWWPYHEAMVIHVHDEVLAHDSQTNQCDVCSEETTGVITFTVPRGIRLQPERNIRKFPPLLTFLQYYYLFFFLVET